jgi:hypothetical protein
LGRKNVKGPSRRPHAQNVDHRLMWHGELSLSKVSHEWIPASCAGCIK